jgi:hypothetical protein
LSWVLVLPWVAICSFSRVGSEWPKHMTSTQFTKTACARVDHEHCGERENAKNPYTSEVKKTRQWGRICKADKRLILLQPRFPRSP